MSTASRAINNIKNTSSFSNHRKMGSSEIGASVRVLNGKKASGRPYSRHYISKMLSKARDEDGRKNK